MPGTRGWIPASCRQTHEPANPGQWSRNGTGLVRAAAGRYQARYPGPDGVDRLAQQTFASKTDANVWLTMKEAEIRRAAWVDPDAGKVLFGDYWPLNGPAASSSRCLAAMLL
jgi:hypothetical protein